MCMSTCVHLPTTPQHTYTHFLSPSLTLSHTLSHLSSLSLSLSHTHTHTLSLSLSLSLLLSLAHTRTCTQTLSLSLFHSISLSLLHTHLQGELSKCQGMVLYMKKGGGGGEWQASGTLEVQGAADGSAQARLLELVCVAVCCSVLQCVAVCCICCWLCSGAPP